MRLTCLLMGCQWDAGVMIVLGGEQLRMRVCTRCRSHKLVAA